MTQQAEELLMLAVIYDLTEGKVGASVAEEEVFDRYEDLREAFDTDEQVAQYNLEVTRRWSN